MNPLPWGMVRGWRGHRGLGAAALGSLVVGIAVGLWVTRPPRPSLVFPPVDPNTGCGAVSLALVGHWLGTPTTIAELNRLTHSGESGISSLQDLKEAAQALGLAAEVVRLNPRRPFTWRLPTVLHLYGDHFVATLPIDGDHLVFNDLPGAPVVLERTRLLGDWDGAILLVAPSRIELDRALARAGLRAGRS